MPAQVARSMRSVPSLLRHLRGTPAQVDRLSLGGHYPFNEADFQMSAVYLATERAVAYCMPCR